MSLISLKHLFLIAAGVFLQVTAFGGEGISSAVDTFATRPLPAAKINTNPHALTNTYDQTATLESLHRLDSLGELYLLDYRADYMLDTLLQKGVKSNSELVSFFASHFFKRTQPAEFSENKFGCSAFLVRADNGHWLFGRNFDYRFAAPVNVVTRTESTIGTFCMNMMQKQARAGSADDGTTDISYYLAAPLGMVDGMNTSGLAVAVLIAPSYGAQQHVDGKGNITTTAAIREILDRAKTVDEAIALFKSHNFYAHGGDWESNYHFFIADAGGKSAVLEYVHSGERDDASATEFTLEVTKAGFVTNNYLYSPWREPLRDTWREAEISRSIGEVNSLSGAFGLLFRLHQYYDTVTNRAVDSVHSGDPNVAPSTLWSLVYDLTDIKTYIVTGREQDGGKLPFVIPIQQL